MMKGDKVIKAEGVSKRYELGVMGGGRLVDDVKRWWARKRGKEDPTLKIGEEEKARAYGNQFWALRDIDFQVQQGEILGIIGENGAGKSTLLKILSRVTGPTEGRVKMKGRVGALLQVGTGFHPELTGRENIYLNGNILGMTKKEVDKKLDEIIDFSGIPHHIDTPVKRYSSGMKVRLGFAVAAHLDPEILIIDEVLAVGDADFQKKCFGKMEDVSKGEGRTILFVSHNMTAVKRICQRVLMLEEGRIVKEGGSDEVVKSYLGGGNRQFEDLKEVEGNEWVEVNELQVRASDGEEVISRDKEVWVTVDFKNKAIDSEKCNLTLHFLNEEGIVVFVASMKESDLKEYKVEKGERRRVRIIIPSYFLNEGVYFIKPVFPKRGGPYFQMKEGIPFQVHSEAREGYYYEKRSGVIRPALEWEFKEKR